MTTDNATTTSSSHHLPLVYSDASDVHTPKVLSLLPFLGFINMTIISVTTIYRAYNHNDIPMIVFIILVYFGSFLLDYWFKLYHSLPQSEKSSKKRNVKIGIWVLLSSIMLGFAWQFSTVMSLTESLCFFGVVIGGNTFLFYVYFIWEGDKSGSVCSTNDGSCCVGNEDQEECKPLTEANGLDNV